MTATALCLCMFAFERVISRRMIKAIFVQPDDIGIAAFMLGMANLALYANNLFVNTVKSFLIFNIVSNFFMAVHTELALRCFL